MKIICLLLCVILFSGCNSKIEQAQVSPTQKQIDIASLSNEKIGWGIKKNEKAPPDVPGNILEMLEKYNAVYIGNTNEKKIYLTFDEGYENGHTEKILDVLKKNEVPAAFFITGDYIDKEPELVKRMAKEGHIIGNHSENHPSFPEITPDEIEQEIKILNEKIEKLTKVKVKYVRPPKGEYSEKVLAKIYNMGYKTVFWSFAYLDWDISLQRGGNYAFKQIQPYIDEGAVLLLHAVSGDNADCLDLLIKDSKAQGYEFCSISEL